MHKLFDEQEIKGLKRRERELRKYLRDLTSAVTQALSALDAEMKKPSTPERGSRIAKISNFLELHNDFAKRFGLAKSKPSAKKATASNSNQQEGK